MKSIQLIHGLKHVIDKKISSFFILLLLPTVLLAQDASGNAANDVISTDKILLILMVVLLAIVIGALIFMASALVKLNKYIIEEQTSKSIDVNFIPRYNLGSFSGIWKKLSGAVPVSAEEDIMLDHNYDGIRELDNQLPPWWKYMFYICILYAIGYLSIYHVFGIGKSSSDKYQAEMSRAEAELEANRANSPGNAINEDNVVQLMDEASISQGEQFFTANCVACHASGGAGNVGPNLTDEYWIHGGGIKNIFHTITNGVPEKGMIGWKTQFSSAQIQIIASYVLSLQGTNPSNPKAAEGDIWVAPIVEQDTLNMESADTTISNP